MSEYVKGQRVRFTTGNLGVIDSFGRTTDDTVGERTEHTNGVYFGPHPNLDRWHMIAVDINGDERYAPRFVHDSMFEVVE